MKKILFIASKYSTQENDPYLTNDLALEFSRKGCLVTVVAYGTENVIREKRSILENIIKVDGIKILKYIFVWPRLFLILLRLYRDKVQFDQIIMFGPCAVMWPVIFFLKRFGSLKRTAIICDIFPAFHVKSGTLPRISEPMLKFVESTMLVKFTEITAMGTNNKQFMEDYYKKIRLVNRVKIVPLWGRGVFSTDKRKNYEQGIRVIFGGQIIKGRAIKDLIYLIEQLSNKGLKITLDIYSKGLGYDELKSNYGFSSVVFFKDQVPRDEYIKLLSNYHVGAVVTDPRLDVPSFPSKVIDYVEAGLAIYCLIEKVSDLYDLDNYDTVYLNPFSFSEEEISNSIQFFTNLNKLDMKKDLLALRDYFSVRRASERIYE